MDIAFLSVVAERIGSAVLVEQAPKGVLSLLCGKVSSLVEINESMKRVMREFEQIKAFLCQVDTRRTNMTQESWLKDVRKIVQDMEDVIDEYTYLTAEESESKFIGISCSAFKKATDCCKWHQLATKLKQVEEHVAHVFVTMRQKFDIKKFDDGEGGSANFVIPSYDVEDDQIIGMVEEKGTLIGWMRDEVPQHFIITVWGMGGSGKTTLVNNAYKSKEIERHFDHKVWIPVSQSFQHIDLLRRIYKSLTSNKVQVEPEIEGLDFATLVEKTQAFLHDSRFLVILDDVWDPDAYFKLENVFHGRKLGSKIVITTRSSEIASLANEQCKMEHRTLYRNEAWELFCNKALWKDANRRCPQEIEEWGRKIVDKCGGLPLAIVAIARLLSLKSQSDWRGVYDRLIWEFTFNPALDSVKHILNLSYYDLPYYLKNCFLYCSIFPEDKYILRTRLIKLWVAEGFVQTRGAQTMEDVAEDYFNELIHRCMLQIVDWNSIGMVKTCRMHDLIRELTLTVSTNENFSMVVTESQPSRTVNEARRLSIHGCPRESMDLSRIRSLIVFDKVRSAMSLLSPKARYLRVLDLRKANISKVPDDVGMLRNLHYLSLKGTKISQLPNSIGKLRNLQTLNLCRTHLQSLPKATTKLKNLRHLTTYRYDFTCDEFFYLPAPRGLWNLTCLQQLHIKADEELVRRLGSLTLLRSFQISDVKGSYCRHLITSLSMMTFLSKLSISTYNQEELCQVKEFGRVFKNLVMLRLQCKLNTEFPLLVDLLGDKIRDLRLRWSGLMDDPLPKLSRLSNLVTLILMEVYDGERLCFGIGWFPKLEILVLGDLPNLNEIKLEKGSLGSLRRLTLRELPSLKQVPQGIEFQESIKSLQILSCNPLLVQMMKGEQKCKVNHIPAIWNFEQRDGEWSKEIIR